MTEDTTSRAPLPADVPSWQPQARTRREPTAADAAPPAKRGAPVWLVPAIAVVVIVAIVVVVLL